MNETQTSSDRLNDENSSINGENLEDKTVKLRNPHMEKVTKDFLYHLALDTYHQNLPELFGDTKFICIGSSPERMKSLAKMIINELQIKLPANLMLEDISRIGHKFGMFKVGPVLTVSRGIGGPSTGVVIHELLKLLYHAKAIDPTFLLLGTSAGIGVVPGTVIASSDCCDGFLNRFLTSIIMGQEYKRQAKLDENVMNDLISLNDEDADFIIVGGVTMSTDDFYEGQARNDGAFMMYSDDDRIQFLETLRGSGVVNMDMEALTFAALTYFAGVKAGVISVVLLDKLCCDRVMLSREDLKIIQNRPMAICCKYIKKCLAIPI